MKLKYATLLAALCALPGLALRAQDDLTPPPVPEPPADPGLPDLPPPAVPDLVVNPPAGQPLDPPPAPGDFDPPPAPDASPDAPALEPVTPPADEVADDAAVQPIQESEEGYLIKDAALNDIFQFLAKQAGRQYFHNIKINTPDYRVTGHLNDGNPLQQMEELAFMYGLMLYTKGNTVYALTQAQLNQLPSAEFTYQLRYLRPTDVEQIKELIKPVLSPGTGIVNFEPKTNTIIIIDTAHRIEQARELLHKIDTAKGQIIVETKIFRVNSAAAERVGVDWSGSLGETGTTLEVARSLNSVFGISDQLLDVPNTSNSIEYAFGDTANLVLSPIQMQGVMRALAEGGFATQVSNPTLITEDNEQGVISIIDRVPIITTTTNQGTSTSSVSEEVRYKIDQSDPTISEDPERHREIGISMVVTPTLLPDGTVRMRLRPRSAQIVDQVKSATTENVYPRVTESMIESLSRVPDGHSLVVGGFYGEVESKDNTKVPLFGDIPVLNFFFRSKETVKEQSSLVFIVTPTSYDPSNVGQTGRQSNRVHSALNLTRDADWVDPTCNPGPAHEPNLRRGIRGLRPQQAPYYPTEEELRRDAAPEPEVQRVRQQTSTKAKFSRVRR